MPIWLNARTSVCVRKKGVASNGRAKNAKTKHAFKNGLKVPAHLYNHPSFLLIAKAKL